MRRAWAVGIGACAIVALAGFAWTTRANQNPDLVAPKPAAEHPLPIKQVVLFNSGVGYFQREGDVTGDSKIDLSFPATDINDLLKSLVLQDMGGGRISTVSYDSSDPLERILHSFAIDLNNNPTFGQILNQARGEKIEIQLSTKEKGFAGKLVGSIVGVESKHTSLKDDTIVEEVVNISGPEGLQSVPMSQVVGVKFLNATLEAEFQRALRVLASSHDMAKKTVAVHFSGKGPRPVRVGYVVERPIWKTSYRLRFEKDGKLSLQGWAIVDNPSDDDWNDVRMVLVSGRPISFQMNLYDPLYIPRPTVEPELFSSLRPQVYGGAMPGSAFQQGINNAFNNQAIGGALGGMGGGAPVAGGIGGGFGGFQSGNSLGGTTGSFNGGSFTGGGFNGSFGGNFSNLGGGPTGPQRITFEELQARQKALADARKDAKDKGPAIAMNFKEGIQSVASAEEAGDSVQYVLDQKISLSRQKSAMLPIINQMIDGTKVSIYNPEVHAKYPLLGLRLKNTSGQQLTQGPITVYDNTNYAGDTRILDLQPNEERLLSYALDQGTEVKSTVKSAPNPSMTFKLGEATISATYKERETKTYVIKNRSPHERTVIVEHAIRSGWTLVSPAKPAEQSRSVYRFEVKVAAGGAAQLVVEEDEPRFDEWATKNGTPAHVAAAGITVKEIVKSHDDALQGIRVVKGLIKPMWKSRESRTLYVQNLSDVAREFRVDTIVRPEWTLQPTQGDVVKGPAVHTTTLKVEKNSAGQMQSNEERLHESQGSRFQEIAAAKMSEFLESPVVAVKVKAGLIKAKELAAKETVAHQAVVALNMQLREATEDQGRLRANLQIIPQTAEPYKNFLNKFVAQETAIEALQRELRAAQSALTAAQRESEVFGATWSAE